MQTESLKVEINNVVIVENSPKKIIPKPPNLNIPPPPRGLLPTS